MTPRITPCYRCPLREGCDHREVLRKRAADTSAVSITYRCDKLAAKMAADDVDSENF